MGKGTQTAPTDIRASRLEVSRATLTVQVEEAIRADIIEGVLTPGMRLTAHDLAARYGVSATPLREALQGLAARHLVVMDPRYGASVAGVSGADVQDAHLALDLIGGEALRRSIDRGDVAWQAQVRRAWEAFRVTTVPDDIEDNDAVAAWAGAHRSFHAALSAGCDSPWLIMFADVLTDHTERYRIRSLGLGARATITEHESIYRLAISGSADLAVEAYRAHLWRTVEVLADTIPW